MFIYLNCDYEQMQSALPAVYSEEQNNLTTQYDLAATNYRAYYTSWCKEDSYEYHNESECNNANLCLLNALQFGKGEMKRYKNCEMSKSERKEYCDLLAMNHTLFANISACYLDTVTCAEGENQAPRAEIRECYGWVLDMTFLDINATCSTPDIGCAPAEEEVDPHEEHGGGKFIVMSVKFLLIFSFLLLQQHSRLTEHFAYFYHINSE